MNKVLLTMHSLNEFERLPLSAQKQVTKTLEQLEKDPTVNSVLVPFKDFRDVHLTAVGDYVITFTFEPSKSLVYILTIYPSSDLEKKKSG